jgi:hypothetical protein
MVLGVEGRRRWHRVLSVVSREIISVKTFDNPLETVYVQEVWMGFTSKVPNLQLR